jgi:hypothetical protein
MADQRLDWRGKKLDEEKKKRGRGPGPDVGKRLD